VTTMTIGLVSDCYHPTRNGVTGMVARLAVGLEARGHRVVLVVPRGPGPPATNAAAAEGLRPADVERRSLPVVPSIGLRLAPATSRGLARLLRREHVDLLHTHTEGPLGIAARNGAAVAGIPAVHTLHTFYRHYLHYLGPTTFAPRLSRRLLQGALAWFLAPYDRVIAPSPAAVEHAAEVAPHIPAVLIPNGVGRAAGPGDRPAPPALLCVGRIAREKRSALLFEALARHLAPRDDLRAIMVGGGGLLADLRREAGRRGLQGRILLPGYLPHPHVLALYRSASVFVSASLSENHPLSWLEAAAAGLPLAVRRDPNLRELAVDGVTGIVADRDDELVERAIRLLDDPDRRAELGAAARRRARRFSTQAHVQGTEQLYRQLLGR
jgi:1,2-diacylglycerol 3-alpha-glucosyltransferase